MLLGYISKQMMISESMNLLYMTMTKNSFPYTTAIVEIIYFTKNFLTQSLNFTPLIFAFTTKINIYIFIWEIGFLDIFIDESTSEIKA